ncbi:hypothetical protein TrRE_jg7384, partial [Triparma retinervis]
VEGTNDTIFLVDTGAEVNITDENELEEGTVTTTNTNVVAFNGAKSKHNKKGDILLNTTTTEGTKMVTKVEAIAIKSQGNGKTPTLISANTIVEGNCALTITEDARIWSTPSGDVALDEQYRAPHKETQENITRHNETVKMYYDRSKEKADAETERKRAALERTKVHPGDERTLNAITSAGQGKKALIKKEKKETVNVQAVSPTSPELSEVETPESEESQGSDATRHQQGHNEVGEEAAEHQEGDEI